MAKPLVFKLKDKEYPLEPVKLDRKKLYGWTEKVALDEKGEKCKLASIDETGSFVIPKGGLGQGLINKNGEWVGKDELIAVDEKGERAEKLLSTFEAPVDLEAEVSVEEFLDHYITSIYTLKGEENCPEFVRAIAKGPIYTFQFSFRGGFSCDPAFLVESKGELFVLVGKKADFEFIGLDQSGFLEAEVEDEEAEDDLDFSMMQGGDMRTINLSNEKKRDALVGFEGRIPPGTVQYVLADGQEKKNIRVLKTTLDFDVDSLSDKFGGLDGLAEALISENPEVDPEKAGLLVSGTRKIYLNKDNKVAYRLAFEEVVRSANGEEKERRPLNQADANIAMDTPVRWTGKLIPKEKAIEMFVFSRKYQIKHVNGLTYDFLFDMAKTLDEANSLVLLATGKKGNKPLIFTSGGLPYRGFLEGRIKVDKYCLILHLTNLEIKEISHGN